MVGQVVVGEAATGGTTTGSTTTGTSGGNMGGMTMLTAKASDGTTITVSTSGPTSGQPLTLAISFIDANGNKIQHQNYAIDVTQNGNSVLSNVAGHTHTGDDTQTSSANLSSSDPVDVQITLNGVGLPTADPSTWTGVKGETLSFTHIVPEFGPVASIVLAIAVISIVVLTAKTRVIPRL
jgi:predicted secreted protein with PEFG-CTERM motif